ncbi:hypothetical protein [Chengkuizengella marina]|uniref:Uncharacterized protein n=1 Tax=Chengkuizengella marina TaxID=2507566 RepID=A0A6N9Q3T1_9BACL|nr:hypothetical protein [Chengkuizengella marina]NBI29466.1 hypothetical protein [Chengkuizengella marina]
MCVNTKDIVTDTLDRISKQVICQIDEYIHDFPSVPQLALINIVENQEYWMQLEPFDNMTFQYEHAVFSFIQLCNYIELFLGVSSERIFVQELSKQMIEMVQGRVQKYIDDVRIEEQMILNDEHERGVVA